MSKLIHLQIKNPKDDETTTEAASQIFSALLSSSTTLLNSLTNPAKTYAFELVLLSQTIYFYMTTTPKNETYVKSLLTSSYPNIALLKTKDPVDFILKSPYMSVGQMILSGNYYLPIKTYEDFSKVDPMGSVLGFLSRSTPNQKALIQILITPANFSWRNKVVKAADNYIVDAETQKTGSHPHKSQMQRKVEHQGGKALIRILIGDETRDGVTTFMSNLSGTFGAYSAGDGNTLKLTKPSYFKKRLLDRTVTRTTGPLERRFQILNAAELAGLWHPPGLMLAGVRNIMWGKTLSGEPPENLPVVETIDKEDKVNYNFFATTEFKNKEQIFGIKTDDRRKHFYIIGKTGAGKSTLIANMAIDDIRRGRGIGIIDPHGDLSEIVLDYIPKRRLNDVVYLEPFDRERPFRLNVLEVKNKEQKELVASGIVSIFYKIYGNSWGPRLEYILRNAIFTLLEIPGASLVEILQLLSDEKYRKTVIPQIQDPVIKGFWTGEFAQMPDRLRAEAVSPIQNKVGQFVSSKMIRNIIGHPSSTIDLAEIMDEGKILILNLSQGKLGEDNAALLGAMIITQIQLAAMGRSFTREEDRRDFFLYVDEFQNFATNSFIKILSEARKYRLSLILANQYIDQLDEEVSRAIFGNVGSLMSFVVGARDATMLSKEFGAMYTDADMVSLGKFETVLKLSINGQTTMPFPATTLPLPNLKNDNREKIIRMSKEKYGRAVKE